MKRFVESRLNRRESLKAIGATAATLFALAEGLMLREKLSPEIAAGRFLTVLGALLGAG